MLNKTHCSFLRWIGTLLLFLFFTSLSLLAQRTLTGTVIDDSGVSIPGANVTLKGTTNGTITNLDGQYTLTVPDKEGGILVFTFIGYVPQEVEIKGSNVIDLVLREDTEVLEEVVVIGYGSVKKDDLTGAVGVIETKDFNQGQATSPEQLVTGKLAGVQITPGGGIPGGASTIRIRGGASLTANNNPLIIIDGMPIGDDVAGSGNVLNTINPNDIASFTVLKDASATAIYGSRASNGVIIITTKQGEAGKPKVSYNGNFGIAVIPKRIEPLSADEFRTLVEEVGTDGQKALLGDANTDWQKEIFQQAYGQDHNLSVSGSVQKVLPFRASVGYTNINGILKTSNMERTTASLSLTPKLLKDNLKVNANAKISQVNNRFADAGTIATAIQMDPTQSVYTDSDDYGGYFEWLQGNGTPGTLAPKNPLGRLELREDLSTVNRFIGNIQLDYTLPFFPKVSANLNLALDNQAGKGTTYVPATAASEFYSGTGGRDNEYFENRTNELLDFYLKYAPEFDKSKIDFTAGYSYQNFYVENEFINRDEARTEESTTIDDFKGEEVLISFFGRMNYSLLDRYLLTLTYRRDGSSRFAPGNKWGNFPAAAFAWNIGREGMFAESNTLSTLKLRVGYGLTGQQDIGEFYPYLPRYTISRPDAAYQFGDEYINTYRPEGYNTKIKWEETATFNVGVDYGFVRDRFSGAVDFYTRNTIDLLNFISVPAGTNFSNQVTTNIGSINNYGIEFTINSVNIDNTTVKWETGFNLTYAQTEITKLTLNEDPTFLGVLTGGIAGGVGNNVQIHSVGYAPNSFFLFEQVYDDAGNPIQGEYVDRDGDGAITELDKRHIEKPVADILMGFNTRLDIGKFDVGFVARASLGNHIYNNLNSNFGVKNIGTFSQFHNNVLPDANVTNFDKGELFSDYYLEDASFLKIDNVSAGYRFTDLFKHLDGRVSLVVQNVLILTKYSGLDPEIFDGIDNNFYPRPRTFILGVNLNL